MTASEKVMITELTHTMEQAISPAWERPKKVVKAIEKSAEKLAHKLSKTIKKEGKSRLRGKHNKPVRAGSKG